MCSHSHQVRHMFTVRLLCVIWLTCINKFYTVYRNSGVFVRNMEEHVFPLMISPGLLSDQHIHIEELFKTYYLLLTFSLIILNIEGTGFVMLFVFLQIQQNSTGMDAEICHVMLAGTYLQTVVYALVFGHCLKAISSPMSLTEKQSPIVCSNKTTRRPAGVAVVKSHVDLIHQVESFLCFLLFCQLYSLTSCLMQSL